MMEKDSVVDMVRAVLEAVNDNPSEHLPLNGAALLRHAMATAGIGVDEVLEGRSE